MQHAAAVSNEYGLAVHIENTFAGVRFYRRFSGQVLAQQIARAHVCFDLGHAKAWGIDSLAGWRVLLL